MGGTRSRASRRFGLQRLLPRAFVLFGALTLAFGCVGLWGLHGPTFAEGMGLRGVLSELLRSLSALLFDAAGLLILERPPSGADHWALSLARLTGLATASSGVLYIVLGVYRESAEGWRLRRFGALAVRGRRPLVVICGLGRIGRQLVADLTAGHDPPGRSVVAIEADARNPGIRGARERGAVVLLGDARDAAVRRRAQLDAAQHVFVVCGDDSMNLDVAGEIVGDVEAGRAGGRRPLHCHANVISPTLARAAHENPTFAALHDRMRFDIFNVVENAARQLVKEELGGRHAPRRDEVAHYVVFGFGTMGQAAALQAGKLAHFENDRRLRMTLIDDWEEPARRKSRRRFLDRHPAFCPDPESFDLGALVEAASPEKDAWVHRAGRPADPAWRIDGPAGPNGEAIPIEYVVNAEFLDLPTDVDAPRLTGQLTARLAPGQTPPVRPCVIVCFDDDRRNLEAALRISEALRGEGLEPPLYVYLPDEPGLATFLRRGREEGTMGDVRPFGACEECAAYARLVQPRVIELAERFREAYQRGREAAGEDTRTPAALDLAFWASNQEAAHHVDIKLAAVERMQEERRASGARGKGETGPREAASESPRKGAGVFTASDLEVLARMEHNRYVAERLLAGWRYGPRDNAGKRRESLVSWGDLPGEERLKDFEQIEALARWLDGQGAR